MQSSAWHLTGNINQKSEFININKRIFMIQLKIKKVFSTHTCIVQYIKNII